MSLPQSQWDSSVFLFFKENCEIRIRRRVMTCCIRSNAQTVNKKPVNKKPSKLSSKSLGGRTSSSVVAFRRQDKKEVLMPPIKLSELGMSNVFPYNERPFLSEKESQVLELFFNLV